MTFRNRRRLRPRLESNDHCFFHVVSRFVDRRAIFAELEKQQFLQLMRRYEAFSMLRVVGYCLMSNHFHILVEASGRPETRPSEGWLIDHVEQTLGKKIADIYRWRLHVAREGMERNERAALAGALGGPQVEVDHSPPAATLEASAPLTAQVLKSADLTHWEQEYDKVLQDIWNRMYDVSSFVQSVKQQFSNWYNKLNERKGTLWEERFRSTIVQGGAAVAEMAAYIDLNPVRAGMVDDPKDYRWSQYGAAMAGDAKARACVVDVAQHYTSLTEKELGDWMLAQGRYRILMYRRGMRRLLPNGTMEGVFDPEEVEKVTREMGQISAVSYVETRVRYFTDGLVIGTKEYVNRLFSEHRERFGEKRKSGARKLAGNGWGNLFAMRNLQKAPLSAVAATGTVSDP